MKMTKTFLLSMLLACTGCTEEINTKEVYVKGDSGKFPDYGEVLAFPGAEGFGRYAIQVDVVEKYITLLILMMMVKVLFEMR